MSVFDAMPFCVGSVVDQMALGQVFLSKLGGCCVSIIPSMLHIHLFMSVLLLLGHVAEAWKVSKTELLFQKSRGSGYKTTVSSFLCHQVVHIFKCKLPDFIC